LHGAANRPSRSGGVADRRGITVRHRPIGHPLLKKKRITLESMVDYPIINLDASSMTGGAVVMRAFEAKGLTPNVVLHATDADVMKAYVAEGLGIGTIITSVYDPRRDRGIRAIPAEGLFALATTYIVLRAISTSVDRFFISSS